MNKKFYFPFPENRISYDCVECGYQCCRGWGTSLAGKEIETLLKLRPDLKAFIRHSDLNGAKNSELTTFGPACFLLQKNGNCEIEEKAGRDVKPWVCRLYPHNEVFRIGHFYVFNFHVLAKSIICPFKVLNKPGAGITYGSILKDLEGFDSNHPIWKIPPSPWLTKESQKIIQREGEIRDLLADLPEDSNLLQILALGTESQLNLIEKKILKLARFFQLDWNKESVFNSKDATLMAVFIPSLRVKYLSCFGMQGYDLARRNLPTFIILAYLFAFSAARASGKEISADLLLRIVSKMKDFFHLAALLEKEIYLPVRKNETIPFSVNTPDTLALIHLLKRRKKMKFWKMIGEATGKPRLSLEEAATYLGALEPLAQFLKEF